jgi:hypothetical protein
VRFILKIAKNESVFATCNHLDMEAMDEKRLNMDVGFSGNRNVVGFSSQWVFRNPNTTDSRIHLG